MDAVAKVRYEVGLALMGAYIVRVEGEKRETVRVGIKSYASACKTAKALEKEAREHEAALEYALGGEKGTTNG